MENLPPILFTISLLLFNLFPTLSEHITYRPQGPLLDANVKDDYYLDKK